MADLKKRADLPAFAKATAVLRSFSGGGKVRPCVERCCYLAAAIDCTAILPVFASSVPVTVTFWPANFSGIC